METHAGVGYVGRVPIRNLWLLMFYASDLFRHRERSQQALEDNPDEIAELVAEILIFLVNRRLRRNLSFGYRLRKENLKRVRGRIDLLQTKCNRLLEQGMVTCRFEELTVDTPRNRYVRAALQKLSRIVERKNLARRCRTLSVVLGRMGVSEGRPNWTEVCSDRVSIHDASDRSMIEAANLAFNLALPTEESGNQNLLSPEREEKWIRKLFEKGIAGFYSVVLGQEGWSVRAGKSINWQISNASPRISDILPQMQTDIVLENKGQEQRIIIDTKFNDILRPGQYREETLRSKYLYQIYSYVRSQEKYEDQLSMSASGMLLHPSINADLDEVATIQGHDFRFATVNLAMEAYAIRRRLCEIVGMKLSK